MMMSMKLAMTMIVVASATSTTLADWTVSQVTNNSVDDDFADASITLNYSQQYVRNQRLVWRRVNAPGNMDIMSWSQGSSSLVHSESRAVRQLAMDWPLVVWERSSSLPGDGLTAWQDGSVVDVRDGYFWSTNLSVSQGRVLYTTDIGAGQSSKAWVWDGSNHLLSFDADHNSQTANLLGDSAVGTVGPVVTRWTSGGDLVLDGGLGNNSDPFCLEDGRVMWQSGTGASSEIVYFDGVDTNRLSFNTVEDVEPVGDGRYITWRVLDRPGGDIMLYDTLLQTSLRLTNDDVPDDSLSIAGGRVVWRHGESDFGVVMLYDSLLGTATTLSDPAFNSKNPQIDDVTAGMIGWTGFDGNDWEVFAATPEPSTAVLLTIGGLLALRRRRQAA